MGDQFDEAMSYRNLYKAMNACARNVRWKDSVAGYTAVNGMENIFKLRSEALKGKYAIDPYQRFFVYEPKKRPVTSTRFKDRVFQRAFCDGGLYDDMTRPFVRTNCACQRRRGVDDAMDQMDALMQRYYNEQRVKAGARDERHQGPFTASGWVLTIDVRGFFPNTQHGVAKDAVIKRTRDKRIAAEACAVIESFTATALEEFLLAHGVERTAARRCANAVSRARSDAVRIGVERPEEAKAAAKKARAAIRETIGQMYGIGEADRAEFLQLALFGKFRGIGLGSQVSQLVELATLDGLDHYIKERLGARYHIRYMDDIDIICDDRERIGQWRQAIEAYMAGIGFEANEKSGIRPIKDGVRFLQWHFSLTDTGKVIRRVSPRNLKRERRRLRKFKERLEAGETTMTAIDDHFQSWRANLERGNTYGEVVKMAQYYKALFGVAPREPKRKKRRKRT
ncbi:MAG: hypothetical protein RSD95_13855 [Clostridia bacterium]